MRIRGKYDVVVCGGGTAGVIASIAASRAGAKTLLVEKDGTVGGLLRTGMAFLGVADAEGYRALGGIGQELLDRALEMGGATKASLDRAVGSVQGQDPEVVRLVALDMLIEAGVDLLFHSWVTDVLIDGSVVQGVSIVNKAGIEIIEGRCFVDCTGDADIVARAKGQFSFGRSEDSLTQPVTRIFWVGGVDMGKMWEYLEAHPEELANPEGWTGESHTAAELRNIPGAMVDAFTNLISKAREEGRYQIPRDRVTLYTLPGRSELGINITRVHGVDGTDPDALTRAEVETQRQMLETLKFLRDYVPGFERTYIISSPYQIGVRETRHIKGSYILTKEDVIEGRDFEDQVGRGAYPLDIHHLGSDIEILGRKSDGRGVTAWKIRRSYGIPLRCLIPVNVTNVIVGGRCISATHEAAASARGQAVCMVTGHAAGVAAALSVQSNVYPALLDVKKVQGVLRSQNAILERDVRIL